MISAHRLSFGGPGVVTTSPEESIAFQAACGLRGGGAVSGTGSLEEVTAERETLSYSVDYPLPLFLVGLYGRRLGALSHIAPGRGEPSRPPDIAPAGGGPKFRRFRQRPAAVSRSTRRRYHSHKMLKSRAFCA